MLQKIFLNPKILVKFLKHLKNLIINHKNQQISQITNNELLKSSKNFKLNSPVAIHSQKGSSTKKMIRFVFIIDRNNCAIAWGTIFKDSFYAAAQKQQEKKNFCILSMLQQLKGEKALWSDMFEVFYEDFFFLVGVLVGFKKLCWSRSGEWIKSW